MPDGSAASERWVIATLTSRMRRLDENTTSGVPRYRASKAARNMAMRCLALEANERLAVPAQDERDIPW